MVIKKEVSKSTLKRREFRKELRENRAAGMSSKEAFKIHDDKVTKMQVKNAFRGVSSHYVEREYDGQYWKTSEDY
jgi:hypothetical protein